MVDKVLIKSEPQAAFFISSLIHDLFPFLALDFEVSPFPKSKQVVE